MMKVLMVADSICGNGIGIVVNRLYHSLKKKGIKCDIVCYQDLNRYPNIVSEIENDGNRIFSIPGVSKGVHAYVKNIRFICREGKYDVIHIHTSLMIFLAAYAAKQENIKKRIGHAHGAKFFNYPEWMLKILEPVGRFLNRRYCTDFVTCSQVSALYTFGKEATFIPNYVPIDDIMSVNLSKIQKLRMKVASKKEFVLGYMGCFDGEKNIIFLPEVINVLRENDIPAKLLLIGTGNMKGKIQDKINDLNINDYVVFLGQRNDCNEWVQVFDCFISPSKTEGMSLSMIEAQMAGKKCFVSSLIPDYSDLKVGLFKKINGFNPDDWAKTIIDSIVDGSYSISRDEASIRISSNRLSENEIIDDLIAVYQSNSDK